LIKWDANHRMNTSTINSQHKLSNNTKCIINRQIIKNKAQALNTNKNKNTNTNTNKNRIIEIRIKNKRMHILVLVI
jgi:hypothetical protein